MLLISILHVIACVILIVVVLMQSGKGGMGGAFGGGGNTQSVFGGSGSGGFLRKLTQSFGAIFMLTSITLAWAATSANREKNTMQRIGELEAAEAAKVKKLEEEAKKAAEEANTPPTLPVEDSATSTEEAPSIEAPETEAGSPSSSPSARDEALKKQVEEAVKELEKNGIPDDADTALGVEKAADGTDKAPTPTTP